MAGGYLCNFCFFRQHRVSVVIGLRRPVFPPSFFVAFVGLFVVPCTSMLSSIYRRYCMYCSTAGATQKSAIGPPKASKQVSAGQRATPHASRQRDLSTGALQYRKHSTAQRNQPAQHRQASICRSGCINASKQTEVARAANVVAHLYSTLSCVLFPGLRNSTTSHTALLV